MKLIIQLLSILMVMCMFSCDDEQGILVNIECPCIYKDEQPPYFKSCQQMGEIEERWGCMTSALLKEVYQELIMPKSALENGIEGTVVVGILIDKEGKVLKSEIKNDTLLGYGLEEESLRVIQFLNDNWCPGLINCEPAEMEFVFPIHYKIAK